jgi:hypothetical protein
MKLALAIVLASANALAWTTSLGDVKGWNTRTLVVYVSTNNCPVDAQTLLSTIDQAMASWNGIPTSSMTLVRAPDPTPATVSDFTAGTAVGVPVILCDPNMSTTSKVDADYIPAVTRTLAPEGRITYGGILLNAQTGASANIANLQSGELVVTLAHELGHVLGLGHSSRREALMYYSIAGKTATSLTEDDRLGMSYLYPRNELAAGAFGCSAVHAPAGALPGAALGRAQNQT